MDQTTTEYEFDPEARKFLDGLSDHPGSEPDLAIDGLSEGILARLVRLFSPRRG